jgi:hypothetical protein
MNVDAGIVYMSIQGNTQNVMYALAAADDGHLLWQAASDKLYGVSVTAQSDMLIQALDFQTGQPLWVNAIAYHANEYPFLPFTLA